MIWPFRNRGSPGHRTLRKKILTGYGVVLCLTLAVLAGSLINLVHLGAASNAILRENYQSIMAAENMIDSLDRQDSTILPRIPGDPEESFREFEEQESRFLLWLGRAQDNITIEGEEAVVEAIRRDYTEYLVQVHRFRQLEPPIAGTISAFYHETLLPSFQSVRKECMELRDLNQQTMFAASEKADRVSRAAFWSVFVMGSAAVVIGLLFSILLANWIVRPVHQIIEGTHKISEGDYEVHVQCDSGDELGSMSRDFNVMVAKLRAYRDLNIRKILGEKKKSEAVIRTIDDGLVILDANLQVEDMNPAAVQIFDQPPEPVKGRHLLEIANDENLYAYVKRILQAGSSPTDEDPRTNLFSVRKGSQVKHYQYSAKPVHAGDPEDVISLVLLLRDITLLKELDRLKSEFVMTASHELRTPLTSMEMSIALLKEKALHKLDARESELLFAADEEVGRLKALVNDLLDISKIEAGRMDLEIDRVPVQVLFEKAVGVLKNQAEEKHIELSAAFPDNLPPVKADVNKITWVLTNLISNALRYTEPNGFVRLSALRAGPQIHISVTDNGAGIPYEYQSRIFDKFVQVKTDKALGGSGLGLAICREIVRAHGGSIRVDSQPGRGSTFTFTIPAAG